MAERTVGTRIMEVLAAEGVDTVSCYPNSPLIEDAAAASLRPVLCRQERVGVNIADGYARASRGQRFGVFIMQWGPGAENAYPGVATAYADSVPLLVLPSGYAHHRENVDRYYSPVSAYASICKSTQRVRSAEEVDAVMRRAVAALRHGRAGPVLVEVPNDVVDLPFEGSTAWTPVARSSPAPDPAGVRQAVELLAGARCPLVVAGQGVLYADATDALVALSERLGVPVCTTLEGKGAFPEDHPHALGCGATTMPGPVYDYLTRADVVLAVGASMMTHLMVAAVPPGKQLVHVSVDPSDFDRDYPVAVPLLADARLALEALLGTWEELGFSPSAHTDLAEAVEHRRDRWLSAWRPLLTSEERPINPYRVVQAIVEHFPSATSIVTHDSGSPRDQLTPFYPAGTPGSYLGWGKSHGLGTGLGLAIGAKLAYPDKHCVAFVGDAAFGMTGLDLETAVRSEAPVTVVVSNNATMAIETNPLREAHERYGARDLGGDYEAIARALGAEGIRVRHVEELGPALEKAKALNDEGRTVLVDVHTSPLLTDFSHKRATTPG